MSFVIDTNACSTVQARHAELVHLTARLVNGQTLRDHHTERNGRCCCCRMAWPCDGRRFAEQVIRAQGGVS